MGSARGDAVGVVFVHGLFSSPKTWDAFVSLLETDEELPFVSTLRFGYASPKFRFRLDRRIPNFNDLAEQLKAFLETEAKNYGRLVLVAHSQGGLLIQRYLARMLSEGRGHELARVRGVVLFACPNDGSGFALSLRRWWWQPHPQERGLRPFDEQVKDAQRTVIRQVVNAKGLGPSSCPIPFWVYGGTEDNVVVRASAHGTFPEAAMLPGDHNSIIQPASLEEPTYCALREHVLEVRQAAPPRPGLLSSATDVIAQTRAEALFARAASYASANHVRPTDFPVGGGAPAQQRAFYRLYNAAHTAGLGLVRALAPVEQDGQVFVQYFDRPSADDSTALVVGPSDVSAAMPTAVWTAIRTVCGIQGTGGADLIGLPVVASRPEVGRRIVFDDATEIELVGGSWGRGWLKRTGGRLLWEPAPSFSSNLTFASGYWTAPGMPYLRLRVLATFPWKDAEGIAVTPERRRALVSVLSDSPLADALVMLLAHRGSRAQAEEWRLGANGNARERVSYISTVNAPNGRAALAAEVMLTLEGNTLITCAEVRIDDADAWHAALAETAGAEQDVRLSLDEVRSVLDAALDVAGQMLPRAVTDFPEAQPWAAPPKVELRLSAEASAPQQLLPRIVDLSPLGTTDHQFLNQMAVVITTAPQVSKIDRTKLLTNALDWMYQSFGFIA